MSKVVCIDDYGVALYKCRFTGKLVGGSEAMTCGATIPGVKAIHVMGNSKAAKEAKRLSDRLFHESEANCNTCSRLTRVVHDKCRSGVLMGRCHNRDRVPTPFTEQSPGVIRFHPDDPMQMPCYQSRWETENKP